MHNTAEFATDHVDRWTEDPPKWDYFSMGKTFKGSLACFPSSTIHYGSINHSENIKASYFLTVAPKDMKDLPNTATQFHPLAIAQMYDSFMGHTFLATLWYYRRFHPHLHFNNVGNSAKIKKYCETLLYEFKWDKTYEGPWIGTILSYFLKHFGTFLESIKRPKELFNTTTPALLDSFFETKEGEY